MNNDRNNFNSLKSNQSGVECSARMKHVLEQFRKRASKYSSKKIEAIVDQAVKAVSAKEKTEYLFNSQE